MKIFICGKCEGSKLSKWFKGKVFRGSRKDVIKHLRQEHFVKGKTIQEGILQKSISNISLNTITKEFKFEGRK